MVGKLSGTSVTTDRGGAGRVGDPCIAEEPKRLATLKVLKVKADLW